MLNAIDLFAGAGRLSVGLLEAGVKVRLAVEIEPDFAETYRVNHPGTRVIEDDVARVDFRKETAGCTIDLLCGGPPCQGFSTVGKKDRHDPRNKLFYEFLRAVDETEPSAVLFENVAGFRGMYEGRAYEALVGELSDRGFLVDSRTLDAADFGLPQFRKRTIVIGLREHVPFPWPTPTHGGESGLFGRASSRRSLMDAIGDLPPIEPGSEPSRYADGSQNDYQRRMRRGSRTLTEHSCANYGPRMREILSLIPPGGSVHDLPERLRPRGYFSNTYARLLPDQPAPTITRNFGTPSSSRCVHPFQNRALSTREGARLQGFPDSYRFAGSKTSKNLQIGNAVPPILGEALGNALVGCLGRVRPTARTA